MAIALTDRETDRQRDRQKRARKGKGRSNKEGPLIANDGKV
jgi:hypothetical protein